MHFDFNRILNVKETGIYGFLCKRAQNPLRTGPDAGEVILEFPTQVEPLRMNNLKLMFKLIISLESCMLIILFLENYLYIASDYIKQ